MKLRDCCVSCWRRRNPDKRMGEVTVGIAVDRTCAYCKRSTRSGLVSA